MQMYLTFLYATFLIYKFSLFTCGVGAIWKIDFSNL